MMLALLVLYLVEGTVHAPLAYRHCICSLFLCVFLCVFHEAQSEEFSHAEH